MRPPFPSAAQAYAESIDSDTTSRHHPDARLTILPLPSLAALYPLDEAHTSSHRHNSSNRSDVASDSSHRNLQVRLLHGNQQQPLQYQRQQPAFQSFEACVQKFNASSPSIQSSSSPPSPPHNTMSNSQRTENEKAPLRAKSSRPEYIGTSMESLLNAIEAHPDHSTSSLSRSPSPFSDGYNRSISSDSTSPFSSPPCTDLGVDYMSIHDHAPSHLSAPVSATATNKARMSIRHLLDDTPDDKPTKPTLQQQQRATKSKSASPKSPKSSSPTFSTIDITKRKWSNLSSANFEEERNAKIRRSIQDHVSGHANQSQMMSEGEVHSNFFPRQVFDTKDPSTRYQMTTICCLHASVAQKSYGSEKRFLCPPPIVTIQAPQGDDQSALSSKPQVTMSVVCENESNSSLGQRSTLEDNHSGTFRYLYVTGSAKAKSFQLKLQVYGQACLPNGFVSNDSPVSEAEEGMINTSDLPEPYAVFDSAPIAIISKPSKKTAKARNVSSCILAGSLVSLFNRINSQTVRTKYMSVQDGEFCAKNSTWSSFSITIVSNGPSGNLSNDNLSNGSNSSTRVGSPKSHHRQSAIQSSSPITYGAEIILTETTTGLQSDRLIVCKVENGRILENATGPICQMQKVALMSTDRRKDGQPLYLSAVGNDHQVGRYMDHSSATKTVLNYQPSTLASGNTDIMKPGSDDSLCWTIVGISKFEYTYFESLPADSEPHRPITPFPTLMKNPVYNAASHTLELVVSNFFSKTGDETTEVPMGVWLGSRGPLTSHILRRNLSTGAEGHPEQTTVSVDLPQGKQMGVGPDEKSLSLPLLFVRHSDGITYNSRATVVFTRPESGERWAVHMA